jgi:murein DD-endopeptidase MepM/ murein hydrolase activator NlpD
MRKLLAVLVLLVVAAGVVWVVAGSAAPPAIEFDRPQGVIGARTPVDATIAAPNGALTSMDVTFEQDGKASPLPTKAGAFSQGQVSAADHVQVTAEISRDTVPSLHEGQATIRIRVSRPVLFGLRHVTGEATKDVQVRLEPPKISVVSTKHYVNLGGSEMIVYRATPADVVSGVKVGEIEYLGYPASGVTVDGVKLTDPALHVAFFALLWDQPLSTPMYAFARDSANNTARADFDYRTFPKPFKQSTIPIDDPFLSRVVPAIEAGSPEIKKDGSLVEQFLRLNGELRRANAAKIASLAAQSAPELFWRGDVFHNFANTKAESAFADTRSYIYQGRKIDEQTHLGFDLASFAHSSVLAANRGKVMYAADLGIYGNCVILDHGMGVQSLYGHLSEIHVKPGQMVDKGQELGKSGMTGMAGGDHLHFTMLVGGHMVNPIEWWDSHWIQDRILRKFKEAQQ